MEGYFTSEKFARKDQTSCEVDARLGDGTEESIRIGGCDGNTSRAVHGKSYLIVLAMSCEPIEAT